MFRAKSRPPIAEALESGRKRQRMSLRDASRRLAEAGTPMSHSTLLRIEKGKLQPAAGQLLHLASIYDLPEQDVLDLVEAERIGAGATPEGTLEEIVKGAEEAFRRGDVPRAFGYALALRKVSAFGPEQRELLQRSCIGFAHSAREYGWMRLARGLLDEVLRDPATPVVAARALLVAAGLWREAGSLLVAEAMLEKAERLVPRDDAILRANMQHQRAKLLNEQKKYTEAMRCLDAALRTYRRAGQTENEMRGGLLGVAILEGMGRIEPAIAAARRAVLSAEKEGYRLLEVAARIELGRLLLFTGQGDVGTRELRHAAALATILENAPLEFHAQYHLWKAAGAAGDRAGADLALRAAVRLLPKSRTAPPAEIEEVRARAGAAVASYPPASA